MNESQEFALGILKLMSVKKLLGLFNSVLNEYDDYPIVDRKGFDYYLEISKPLTLEDIFLYSKRYKDETSETASLEDDYFFADESLDYMWWSIKEEDLKEFIIFMFTRKRYFYLLEMKFFNEFDEIIMWFDPKLYQELYEWSEMRYFSFGDGNYVMEELRRLINKNSK